MVREHKTTEFMAKEYINYLRGVLDNDFIFDLEDKDWHGYIYIRKKESIQGIFKEKIKKINYAKIETRNSKINVYDSNIYNILLGFGNEFDFDTITKDWTDVVIEQQNKRIVHEYAKTNPNDPGPYTKPAIPEKKETVKPKNVQLKKEIQTCINNLDIIIENTNENQHIIKLRNQLVTTLNKLPKDIRKGWSSRMYKANELIKGE